MSRIDEIRKHAEVGTSLTSDVLWLIAEIDRLASDWDACKAAHDQRTVEYTEMRGRAEKAEAERDEAAAWLRTIVPTRSALGGLSAISELGTEWLDRAEQVISALEAKAMAKR